MDLSAINSTILRHQVKQLTEAGVREALEAAQQSRDRSLEGRRLAAACTLSDSWPMSVCIEVARVLIAPLATAVDAQA